MELSNRPILKLTSQYLGVQVSSEQKIGIRNITSILQNFLGAETLDLSLGSSWRRYSEDTVGEFAKDYALVVNSAMKRLRALSAAL